MLYRLALTVGFLAVITGCASGPENAARDLMKALRDNDRLTIVSLCSDSSLAAANQLLLEFKENPTAAVYLIGCYWRPGITEELFSSWTAESLLVGALIGGELGQLSRDPEMSVQRLSEGESRICILGSQASDSLQFFRGDNGWTVSIDQERLTFGPDEVLMAFLVAVEEGNGTFAVKLMDSTSVSEISGYLNLLQSDPIAYQLLARHGIEASMPDIQSWTPEEYMIRYLSVAGLETIASAIPDSMVIGFTSGDTAIVTSYLDGSTKTARLCTQHGIWSIIASSSNLPLPSRVYEEGTNQPIWTRVLDSRIDQLISSNRLVVSGYAPYGSSSQDYIIGLNTLTGASCWSRSELGLDVVSVSQDSSRLYVRGLSHEILSVSAMTGSVLWTFWPESQTSSTSYVFDTGQEVLISVDAFGPLADDTPSTVICLDRETGDIIWSYELPRRELVCMENPNGDPTGPMESVSSGFEVDSGKAVFATTGSNIYCLDTVSGDLRWRNYTGGVIREGLSIIDSLLFTPGGGPWGWGSSFIGGVPGDDHFYCLEMESGERVWFSRINPYILYENVVIFLGDTVRCVEQSTGDSIWLLPFETETSSANLVSNTVNSGVAFLSTGTDLCALELSTGSVLWSSPQQDLWGLCCEDDYLFAIRVVDYTFPLDRWEPRPDYSLPYPTYGGSAGLVCIDARTGNVLWEVSNAVENSTDIILNAGLAFTRLGETVRCFSPEADGSIPFEIWSQ